MSELSHELRTALMSVVGYAELLQSPTRSADVDSELVGAIHANSRFVVELLDSMLHSYRSGEAGELSLAACRTEQIVGPVLTVFCRQALAKGLKLCYRPGEALPPEVVVDVTRVRRVLVNLVSNSIKYSARGTITMRSAHRIAREDAPADIHRRGRGRRI